MHEPFLVDSKRHGIWNWHICILVKVTFSRLVIFNTDCTLALPLKLKKCPQAYEIATKSESESLFSVAYFWFCFTCHG
jgi:hypothetical protein